MIKTDKMLIVTNTVKSLLIMDIQEAGEGNKNILADEATSLFERHSRTLKIETS